MKNLLSKLSIFLLFLMTSSFNLFATDSSDYFVISPSLSGNIFGISSEDNKGAVEKIKTYIKEMVSNNENNATGIPYKDIDNHWSKPFVEDLHKKGLLENNSNFNPNNFVSRAEALKIIFEGLGYGQNEDRSNIKFKDVDKNSWYAGFLSKAIELGVIDQNGKNSFRPNDPINRVEVLKIMLTASKADLNSVKNGKNFKDIEKGSWYSKYINYASSKQITSGYLISGKFRPNNYVTRGQMAKMLSNLLKSK